jgi:monoterpene epsilon-lactone hydrolase
MADQDEHAGRGEIFRCPHAECSGEDKMSVRAIANVWMMRRFAKPQMSKEKLAERTLEQQRQGFESIPSAKPPKGTIVEALRIGELEAERLTPPGANPERALLWFFGGGYCMGSPASTRGLAARIAAAIGAWALVPAYRLSPEHPLEASLNDAVTAYRWLVLELGSADQIVVGGASAGGGLALRMLCALRDAGDPLPAAASVISPWTDLAMTGPSVKKNATSDPIFTSDFVEQALKYLPSVTEPSDPRISPLYADLSGLQPVIIHVSGTEMFLDDSVRFAERARSAGVEVNLRVYPGLWHVFPASGIPEASRAIKEIADFARNNFATRVSEAKTRT